MEITGTLKKVMNEQQVTEKFKKREFVITTKDKYPQDIILQLTQANCDIIDNFKVGDEVKAHFNLRGKEYTNKEGKVSYFTSIEAWKIEMDGERKSNNDTPEGDGLPF